MSHFLYVTVLPDRLLHSIAWTIVPIFVPILAIQYVMVGNKYDNIRNLLTSKSWLVRVLHSRLRAL